MDINTGLPALYEKYGDSMEFSLACDKIDGVIDLISGADAKIVNFLVIENPTSQESIMTVLLDALIKE